MHNGDHGVEFSDHHWLITMMDEVTEGRTRGVLSPVQYRGGWVRQSVGKRTGYRWCCGWCKAERDEGKAVTLRQKTTALFKKEISGWTLDIQQLSSAASTLPALCTQRKAASSSVHKNICQVSKYSPQTVRSLTRLVLTPACSKQDAGKSLQIEAEKTDTWRTRKRWRVTKMWPKNKVKDERRQKDIESPLLSDG